MPRKIATPRPDAPKAALALQHQEQKKSLIARLRRVEGQLRGVQAMIERSDDCEAVLQQMAAARKALERAFHATIACAYEMEADQQQDQALTARVRSVSELLIRYG